MFIPTVSPSGVLHEATGTSTSGGGSETVRQSRGRKRKKVTYHNQEHAPAIIYISSSFNFIDCTSWKSEQIILCIALALCSIMFLWTPFRVYQLMCQDLKTPFQTSLVRSATTTVRLDWGLTGVGGAFKRATLERH